MACLEMFNTDQQQHQCAPPPMSPRISFSNDFVDTQQAMKQFNEQQQQQQQQQQQRNSSIAAASNFEFSVSNFNMMSADELFSKGRLLPFKQDSNGTSTNKITTLRDELLNDDDDNDDGNIFSMKPPKGPVRWKEFLGLNKRMTHVLSSKNNNKGDHINNNNNKGTSDHGSNVVMERVLVEGNESMLIQKEDEEEEKKQVTKISDELVLSTDGGSSCRDNVEIGI